MSLIVFVSTWELLRKIKNLYEKKDGAIKSINDSVLVQALKYLNNIRNIIWDIKAISAYYIT